MMTMMSANAHGVAVTSLVIIRTRRTCLVQAATATRKLADTIDAALTGGH